MLQTGTNSEHRYQVPEQPAIEPGRVLVIEDDAAFRSLVSDSLRAVGYEVLEASDGHAALLQFQQLAHKGSVRLPDIIVSDVRMPRADGMDVLRTLRQEGWSMPVVLMSGFPDAATSARALGLGATVVLDKPFAMSRLQELVTRYVDPQP